jgi:hypothetical protein
MALLLEKLSAGSKFLKDEIRVTICVTSLSNPWDTSNKLYIPDQLGGEF